MPLRINNRDARRLWLSSLALASAPTGKLDLLKIIKQLGFVQLDTIQNVSRAHHHILWSRNQHYREPMLNKLLAEERAIFEHFTHDAAVLPMDFYPTWTRQFRRMGEKMNRSNYYRTKIDGAALAAIKARIVAEGPLSTHAFDTKVIGKKAMWSRPPHKLALDHMWYCGELSTSHRENFNKFYDLSERVIPKAILNQKCSDEAQIDWLCRAALERLSFAALGEIQRFWAAADSSEIQAWAKSVTRELVPVEVESVYGSWFKAVAPADIEQRIAAAPALTSRLRIINPFDPAIRDRARLARLFGFDYRIEIFVPAAKRRWGYYVYPLLEADRFVGRIELKSDRKANTLNVVQLWSEPGITWSNRRTKKLDAELARLSRFVGASEVFWCCGRTPF